jgi:hypothetical protein
MKSDEIHDCGSMIDAGAATKIQYLASRRARRFRSMDVVATSAARLIRVSPPVSPGAFEFNALPDSVLLGWLAGTEHRPNVLIECAPGTADTAMRHVMTWCQLPFRYGAVPGALELPTPSRGTLLLNDVGALTLSQQVKLYDWLTAAHGQVQVISMTCLPLVTLVEDGEFLEALLYRLNVIRLDGVTGTRPAPLKTWQPSREQREQMD